MSNASAPTIEQSGRRFLLRNLPFAAKDAAKNAGCKWDPEARCWWSGKRETAESVVASLASAPASSAAPAKDPSEQVIAGKATHKGRSYYVAGRVVRGRTHWDDSVTPIQSRDGALLLVMRDGQTFWSREAVMGTTYERPKTLRGILAYAEKAREMADRGDRMPVAGCSDCRAAGRMCAQCEHDD